MTDTTVPATPVDTTPAPADPTTNVSLWENLAAFVGKFINDETSVGKAGKAAKWSALAVIAIAILTALTSATVAPALVALHWGVLVIIANVVLVLLKNMFDKTTKNF